MSVRVSITLPSSIFDYESQMTLYATVKSLDVGYQHDREQFEKACLKLEDRFVVRNVSMGQSHTNILLEGFDVSFNSVAFDYDEDGEPINIYEDARYNPYLRPYQ